MSRFFSTVFFAILAFLAFFSLPLVANAESVGGQKPSIAYAMRVVGDESRFRILLDFDSPTSHKLYLQDSPKRLVLELPNTYFALEDDEASSGEDSRGEITSNLIEKISWGRETKNKPAQIVFNLTQAISIVSVLEKQIEAIDDSTTPHFRLVIDAVQIAENNFIAQNNSAKTTIVIDPGHGGIDGGAVRKSILEKNITLQFSKLLQEKLAENFNIILTRQSDIFVPLTTRREIAQVNSADLFISVHADAAPQSHVRGATFYILSEQGNDELSNALAKTHNQNAELNLLHEAEPAADILISLARRETKKLSRQFSQLAISNLQGKVHLINNPIRGGNFAVLRNPYTPSVLLELGYLSNSEDAKLLVQTGWQENVASLLAKSIEVFFNNDVKIAKKSAILLGTGE